ncbi:hypothetical protein NSQ95_15840 [Psychrobacillus sp. FSL W7-1457]|uniref:hypothetical protein n=1 Tax=Psychrobacillus sp. FSL W7-1457 TaxID=2954547 RepID=UPI00315AE0AE
MNKRKRPFVISVAAVSGGGKTTVVKQLIKALHNSKALYFDDYELGGPHNFREWIIRGANYDEWDIAPFKKDLINLIEEPLEYIVLDCPFAKMHKAGSVYIDMTVFIDTPLDIAMARRVLRDFQGKSGEEIIKDMENYNAGGRAGYLEMLKTIMPNSDLVVDGTLSVAEIVATIEQHTKN